jgi:predicted DNA-binding transcriptional regulator AlpA
MPKESAKLPTDDIILSEKACSLILGISVESLKRMRRAGQAPPAFEINKYRFTYSRTLVLRWLQSRTVEGESTTIRKVEGSES